MKDFHCPKCSGQLVFIISNDGTLCFPQCKNGLGHLSKLEVIKFTRLANTEWDKEPERTERLLNGEFLMLWEESSKAKLDFTERDNEAKAHYNQGMKKVKNTLVPKKQKFSIGAKVRIAKDLGEYMLHFPGAGTIATVVCTYAHAFGGNDVKNYKLDVKGCGSVAWYHESQLTLVKEKIK